MRHLPWLTCAAIGAGLALASFDGAGRVDVLVAGRGAFAQELALEFSSRARVMAAAFCLAALALGIGRSVLWSFLGDAAASWQDLRRAGVAAATNAFRSSSPGDAVAIAIIVAVAIGLRVAYLWQPIRNDEAITVVEFASQPLIIGLSYYPAPNNHLFHTLLVHAACLSLGDDVWAVRLPALVAGLVLVPATLIVAQIIASRAAGVLAAALVATSSILVEYSTNARGYTLVALIFVCGLGLVAYIARTSSAAGTLVLCVLAVLGFWTMPTMLYGFAVWMVLLLLAGWRRVLPVVLIVAPLTLLVYLPPVIVSGPERILANQWVMPLSLAALPAALGQSLIETSLDWHRDIPWPLSVALIVGLLLAQVRYAHVSRLGVPTSLVAVIVCLLLVLVQRVAPFERVWLFLLPLYLLEASAGFMSIRHELQRAAPWLAAIIAVGLGWQVYASGSVLSSDETGAFPEAEAITRELRNGLAPGDTVQTCVRASLPELQYYFRRYGLDTTALVRPTSDSQRAFVIVRSDVSECTPQVMGSRPIDWSLWQPPRPFRTFGSITVFELVR